jgi:acyl-CoA thioesterase
MHNPGKRQCLEAIYPNMVVEQFNCVNYDFQNPDPRNWVRFGNRTTDDMARHWLTFYYMSDAEFQVEVNARKAVKRGTANQQ